MPNKKPRADVEKRIGETLDLIISCRVRTKKELHDYYTSKGIDITYNQAAWLYDRAREQCIENITPEYIREQMSLTLNQYKLLFRHCYEKKDYRACAGILDSIVHLLQLHEVAKQLLQSAPEVNYNIVTENIDDDR